MFSPEAILPVTTPLAHQEQLPVGLPATWYDYPPEAQAAFLRSNGQLLRVNTYISAGLEVGARRLDAVAMASGASAVHEATLYNQFKTSEVNDALIAGNTDYSPVDSLIPSVSGSTTGDRGQMVATARNIEEYFGPKLINKSLLNDMFGFNSYTGKINPAKPRVFSTALFYAIEDAGWHLPLRAVAGLQHLHQAAARNARGLVKPLVAMEAPLVQQDKIDQYWGTRLAGSPRSHGAAYFVGYRAKSAPTLDQSTRDLLGDDNYSKKRETLITALNINSSELSPQDRDDVQKRLRKPVLRLIGQEDFDQARAELQKAADKTPQLFSLAAQRFLQDDSK